MQQRENGISKGSKLKIIVTEPWEVVTDLPSPIFYGYIVDGTAQAVMIHLDEPISRAGSSYFDFLAIPRHLGDAFANDSGSVFCNLVSMTKAEVNEGIPSTPSKARGDLMLMGDVAW